jgi:polyamine oxidase
MSVSPTTRRELLRLAAGAGAGAALAGPLARIAAAASPTQTYDDGSDAIPGGLVGHPERVIIVGSGWAGLTAANALRNAGVDHVVLEARNRVGGRAHTVDLDGIPVDLGCSWIHGPIGNPMFQFAKQAGVGNRSGNVELDTAIIRYYDAYVGRDVSVPEKFNPFGYALRFESNDAASISTELGPRASVRDGAIVYMDRAGLTGDDRRRTEFLIRLLSEFTYGHDWAKLALFEWANHESSAKPEQLYVGPGQGELPVGGYRPLIKAMTGSEPVRLGHRVHTIEQGPSGVVVRAVAGKRKVTLRGSHVLVTVPLGVLKLGAIRFSPRLPLAKRAAIARVGFGALEKVAMAFDEPFWSDATHTHILFQSKRAYEFPYWTDLNRFQGAPALVSFNGGPFARSLRPLKPEQRLALTLTRLQEILGRSVPAPRAWAATAWQKDPFCNGSYSTTLVGGSRTDMDTLADPVRGRILFAGEATNRIRRSTADGALSSGVREAKRLLHRTAVGLSAG